MPGSKYLCSFPKESGASPKTPKDLCAKSGKWPKPCVGRRLLQSPISLKLLLSRFLGLRASFPQQLYPCKKVK